MSSSSEKICPITSSGEATPTKSSCSSESVNTSTPGSFTVMTGRTPTKMYTPIPVTPTKLFSPIAPGQTESSVKEKTAYIDEFSKSAAGDIDTHLKSALYSVTKHDTAEATQELEKLRRLNKAHQKKLSCLIQDLNKHFKAEYESKQALQRENNSLNLKVGELQKNMEQMLGYEGASDSEFDLMSHQSKDVSP